MSRKWYYLWIPILGICVGVLYSYLGSSFEVQSRLADGSLYNNEMQLNFRVYNNSSGNLNLRTTTLRYHFTENTPLQDLRHDVWWFSKGASGDVSVSFSANSGDARFFEISFTQGWLTPGDYAEVQMRVRKTDWSFFDESDDPSVPAGAQWVINKQVELLIDGKKVWGDSPVSFSSSSQISSSSAASSSSLKQMDPVHLADLLRSPGDFTIWGTEGVWLADRTTGYYQGVELYGSVGTNAYAEMGADSRVQGGLYARDSAFLREKVFLDGDLRVGLGYASQNSVTIRGTIATASPGPQWSLPRQSHLEDQVGVDNVVVPVNSKQDLSPGSYNHVQVFSRSTLRLTAGTYILRSFRLEPDVTLELDVADGPVILLVLETVNFADRTRMVWTNNHVNPLAFQVYQQGNSDLHLGTDLTLAGRILAPDARIRVSSRVLLAGWLQGKEVQIEPDTKICEPPTLEGFTHSEVAYGPGFDALQSQYHAVVERSVSKLRVYGKVKGNGAQLTIAGENSGEEHSISAEGRQLHLRLYDGKRATVMPWCAETRYTLSVNPDANAILRVKTDAPCSEYTCDGSSWNKAFRHLSTALTHARQQGKAVQVAEGIYPLQGDRQATYLLGAGMDVRGGFTGIDGETVENRRGDINKVILSGDIAGNDGNLWPPATRPESNTDDNAYHVVTLLGGHSLPFAQRLDRLSIQGGVADGDGVASFGAGIFSIGASPGLEYLIVHRNLANAGGALYAYQTDTLHLSNSYVVENQAMERGGALAVEHSNTFWTNLVVSQNKADLASVLWSEESRHQIWHTTIAGNSQSGNETFLFLNRSHLEGINSIVHSSYLGTTENSPVHLENATASWDHCHVEGAWKNESWNYTLGDDIGGNISETPIFQNAQSVAGLDGVYFGVDDGLQLASQSAGVDNAKIMDAERVGTDIFATARPVGNVPDLGAYEAYETPSEADIEFGYTGLITGKFTPVPIDQILRVHINEKVATKLHKSGAAFTVRARVQKNKHLKDSFYANVCTKNGGKCYSKSQKIWFYRISENGDNTFTYATQRVSDGVRLGKPIIFTIEDWDSESENAYFMKASATDFSLYYSVPHKQF